MFFYNKKNTGSQAQISPIFYGVLFWDTTKQDRFAAETPRRFLGTTERKESTVEIATLRSR